MKWLSKHSLADVAIPLAAVIMSTTVFAGSLYLEVVNPEANREAKDLQAVLVARVSACHEPAKSTVKANVLQMVNGNLRRTPLKVVPLANPGTFAVIGPIRGWNAAAVEVSVTNPEYQRYEPRVLIRLDGDSIQWGSLKRFWNSSPGPEDLKAVPGDNNRPSGKL
jgi:hypothetical protein